MSQRDRWLNEGMNVLREQGINGVRVDRVAARLELTKGSFHHHFDGVRGYRRSLLERYEIQVTEIIEDAKAAVLGVPPLRALVEAPQHVPFDPRLEAAIRGWAFEDQDARDMLQRIDTMRSAVLTDLWQSVVGDPQQARAAALIPHLIMIGASVALPTPSPSDMEAVFALLARLAPFVAEQAA